MGEMDWLDLGESEIARRLAAAQQTEVQVESPGVPMELLQQWGPARPAAVLMPLLRQPDGWHLLYTRRNQDLPEHSGQVSFPGGRSDPDELDPEQTALRETFEEIGLEATLVRVLGRLQRFLTVTNYVVTPVVGVIPWPTELNMAHQEVSRVFTIPLSWLADPANREMQYRQLPKPYAPAPVIYFRQYDGEVLWGASARFTVKLMEVLHR